MKINRVSVWGGYRDVMDFGWMKLGGKVMMRARNDGQSRSRDGRCVSISHVSFLDCDGAPGLVPFSMPSTTLQFFRS